MNSSKLDMVTIRANKYKAGPGRPPGRKNNHTIELEQAVQQAASSLPEAFEGDAHAFLASIYKNPDFPVEIRILAAGKALRVEKPVLSAVHGRMDINFDIAGRLEAARKRVISLREVVPSVNEFVTDNPSLMLCEFDSTAVIQYGN